MEYALQAVKLGTTAIGIRTKEGVVLAAEKRITSKLMEPSSVEKIMEVGPARGGGLDWTGVGGKIKKEKEERKSSRVCIKAAIPSS